MIIIIAKNTIYNIAIEFSRSEANIFFLERNFAIAKVAFDGTATDYVARHHRPFFDRIQLK